MYFYTKLRFTEFPRVTHLSGHREIPGQQQHLFTLSHSSLGKCTQCQAGIPLGHFFWKQYDPTQPSSLFILLERCCRNHGTGKGASAAVCMLLFEQSASTGNPAALSFSISFQRLPFCF